MKTLIVFYSRTGTTRKVAGELKVPLSADVEEIVDHKNRGGPIGFLQSGREAKNEATPEIDTPKMDPSGYDLVVICTPVWASKMASPVRSYLTQMKEKLRRVAFLCTCGNPSGDVFEGMERLAGKPAATLVIKAKDMRSGEYAEMVKTFAERVKAS